MSSVKEKILNRLFIVGPVFKNVALPYFFGHQIINLLIKTRALKKFREKEIAVLSEILSLIAVDVEKHPEIINEYLFYNTWNPWRLHYLENKSFFKKNVIIIDDDLVKTRYSDGRVAFLLYNHNIMSTLHCSLVSYSLEMDFISLGNTNKRKYLLWNNQDNLPEKVLQNPLKYKKQIRRDQLKKVIHFLKRNKSGIINYFFDGQEGSNFEQGTLCNLHYKISTDICRFIHENTSIAIVEPFIKKNGNVILKFHNELISSDLNNLKSNLKQYYEDNFLTTLPKLNLYMINQILKSHYDLKNNEK
jgi:hypothetical protein